MTDLRETALHALHVSLSAKMVPFAGYAMPVQYPSGILAEHRHARAEAGLFDVGHMGQARIHGADATRAIEALVPGDIQGLDVDHTRYTQLTNEAGGILDDLMITRRAGHLFLVVNAACKEADFAHIQAALPKDCRLEILETQALIAVQGPAAIAVLEGLSPGIAKLDFMSVGDFTIAGFPCLVSRSGYTGEDGVEISTSNAHAEALAQILLRDARVKPVGLGARDTLRLEAGLCLYGHDIDTTTTPVEAALAWSIGKRRRAEGGFAGAGVIQKQLTDGVTRKRVGILPEGRVPVRDGAEIADASGAKIGTITSGGFGPTIDRPIAMGYVPTAAAANDSALAIAVRGKTIVSKVARLPFVAHRYHKS